MPTTTFTQKLFLTWAGGVIVGVILHIAGIEAGETILGVLVAFPVFAMIVWGILKMITEG